MQKLAYIIPALFLTLTSTDAAAYSATWEDSAGQLGVKKMFEAKCTGCHSSGTFNWTDQKAIKANLHISDSDYFNCSGIVECAGPDGPMPATFTQSEIDTLLAWEDAGFPPGNTAPPPDQYVGYWMTTVGTLGNRLIGVEDILKEHCTSCHRPPSADGGTYPQWLDFTSPTTMRANSYYSPGFTKAEAAVFRVMDGTMPPGAPWGTGMPPEKRQAILDWVANQFLTMP